MIILAIVTAILIALVGVLIVCKVSIELDKKKGIQFKTRDLDYIDGFQEIDKNVETTMTLYFNNFTLDFKGFEDKKSSINILNIRDIKIYDEKEDLISDIKYHKIKSTKKIQSNMLTKKKQIVIKVFEEGREIHLIFSSSFPELIKGTLEKAIEQEKEELKSKNAIASK
ncbi:hypothetical protein [Clostridium sp. ATCC 25772]|uniref:hypothetical protein n=1 Tax=Clostridium sp. ATCC 25772 TaxID=1676991 RepID=UPI000784DBEC|nr:hypothetical protein [Clostridium sp. ATCC 25772]